MPTLSRLTIIAQTFAGPYRYTWRDRVGYIRHGEYPCHPRRFPPIESLDTDGGFARLRIGGHVYYWPATSTTSGLEWMYAEVFEPAHSNFHAYEYGGATLAPDDLVVDAGACEGFFIRYARAKGARVLAIEPTASVVAALHKTFADEIADNQVEIQCAALGASSHTGKLQQVSANQLYENSLGNTGVDVRVVTLDDLLQNRQPGFIKMDIEGGEMDAIRGAQSVLRRWKPRLSIAVYHGVENAQLVMDLIRSAHPDYHVMHRGIFAWDNQPPRPMMIHAW